MRTITLLFAALVLGTTAHAQTVATFESLTLATTDTYYVNYSASGTDVGFNDGLAHFPCVYDATWASWSGGFAYSNVTDTYTSGYMNQYASKAGTGNNSAKYAAVFCSDPTTFANFTTIKLTGAAIGKPVYGFNITNSTYAYNSMRDGDMFAKKFGGPTGTDPDWFLLTVKGYLGGVLKPQSVQFYLADFRYPFSLNDYILDHWYWVDLLPLGAVDELRFELTSSDVGSFGMNTPSYFCMDNFQTKESTVGVDNVPAAPIAKVYPNPATDVLYVDVNDNAINKIIVTDMIGKTIADYTVTGKQVIINTASLQPGTYMLQLSGNGNTATTKFIKK